MVWATLFLIAGLVGLGQSWYQKKTGSTLTVANAYGYLVATIAFLVAITVVPSQGLMIVTMAFLVYTTFMTLLVTFGLGVKSTKNRISSND